MDRAAVEAYLCQAAAAESVRELHAIAQAVRVAHPDDADAELVEPVCWAAVPRLFTPPPRPAARTAVRVRERRGSAPVVDWKARAAGM